MSSRQQQRQRARRAEARRQRAQETGGKPPSQKGPPTRGSSRSGSSRRGSTGPNRGAIAAGIAAFVIVVAAFGYAAARGLTSSPTPTPLAAPTPSVAPAVDGIQCGTMEQLAYHIHQHLALYENGKQVQVPSEIGIPGGENNPTCYYWVHVHASTPDIIHVESPVQKTFHLGNFFDIWKATKSSANPPGDAFVLRLEAAARNGTVHAFLNGKPWHGSYRSIPLKEHGVITVEIGKPAVQPKPFTSWNGL